MRWKIYEFVLNLPEMDYYWSNSQIHENVIQLNYWIVALPKFFGQEKTCCRRIYQSWYYNKKNDSDLPINWSNDCVQNNGCNWRERNWIKLILEHRGIKGDSVPKLILLKNIIHTKSAKKIDWSRSHTSQKSSSPCRRVAAWWRTKTNVLEKN